MAAIRYFSHSTLNGRQFDISATWIYIPGLQSDTSATWLYIGTWLTIWYISYLALHGWDSASPQLFDSSYLADTLMPQLPDPTWLSSWIFQPTWHGISRLIDSSLLDICLKLDPPKMLGLFLESVVLHCLQVVVHTWNMAQFFSSPTPLW